ncbi:zinc finger, RING/FYVE/PHD-type [Artemisia annua]|uniref:Zinc finger, RING/FYVE/PHD-type n=1 Tax=Artemisia annua TaxID=35608 RepID=A0A2U1MDD3_ARTAN|nr:zinc finger, RING/FYVE/PHD-type [Artemisia annua]
MSGTGDSYSGTEPGKTDTGISYVLGLAFAIIILLITLSYASYKCNRSRRSSLVPQDNQQLRTIGTGVNNRVLATIPAFVFSDDMVPNKSDTNASCCSICLVDYKAADVVRLLPECGHLFHRQCIDPWLKVRPTCPVCRSSPLSVKVAIQES